MALDQRQSFKFGFLLRCAEEGLTPVETGQRIKQAFDLLGGAKGFVDGVRSMGLWGLAGAAGTGMGAGYLGARMTEPDADPEEAKKRELIAALQHYTDQARRSQQRFAMRPSATTHTPPRLMG